jgi:hypothetical protein
VIAREFGEESVIVVELDAMVTVVDEVVGVEQHVLTENSTQVRVECLELRQRLDEDGKRARVNGTEREALHEYPTSVGSVVPTG